MAGLTYMQRRPSGIYEFRKRLPQELAGRQAPKHLHSGLSELINPKTGIPREKRLPMQSLGVIDFHLIKNFSSSLDA